MICCCSSFLYKYLLVLGNVNCEIINCKKDHVKEKILRMNYNCIIKEGLGFQTNIYRPYFVFGFLKTLRNKVGFLEGSY